MADVIVIGGGIAGCAAAYYLAADGVDVTLLERGQLNERASGANAGSLHAQIQFEPFVEMGESWAREYLPVLPFYAGSIALWQEAGSALGVDLGVTCDGGLIVASNEREMRLIEKKTALEREAGLGTELLDARDLRALAPYVSSRMIGGAFCPLEGKANPLAAAPAFAAAAEALGATVRTGCEVTGIRRGSGIFRLQTPQANFEARRLVACTGPDTRAIAGMAGARFEMASYPLQLAVTEPLTPIVRHLVYAASDMLTLKQTTQGTVLIGGGWPALQNGSGRAQVGRRSLAGNLAVAVQVVPELGSAQLVRTWAAHVNGTRDWRPLLGEVPGVPGLFLNYVPWMGFTGGPAGGRIVASLLQGREAPVEFDVSHFAP